jgi:hypothetical protein
MNTNRGNPYVGPRTFSKEEADLFFGREREARDLLALVVSRRLVLFYAESGAGKSSLLNTRLIPDLEQEGFVVLPVGRVGGELAPGCEAANIYTFNLMRSLVQQDTNPGYLAGIPLADFLARLNFDGKGFSFDNRPLEKTVEAGADHEIRPRALIIDQFEELFSAHPEAWEKREDFFRQLAQAMEEDPYLRVVLVMREDYIAALDPYAHLLPGALRARYYMQRMDAKAALEAVAGPARTRGRPFTETAAQELVNVLCQVPRRRPDGSRTRFVGQFVEPVQLQVVCYQLWERLKGRPGSKALEALAEGKDLAQFADNALGQFYEQAIATVLRHPKIGVVESELRNWFSQELITESGTRSTVYQGNEKTGSLVNEAVRVLADQFLVRAESRAGGRWYELVHDRFIEPILEANQDWWLRQNPLFQAAQEWDRQGRERYQLYVGRQLEQALANVNWEASEPMVREFLEASKRANQAREEEVRVRRRFDRFVSLGALLGGAAIGGYVPIILLLFAFDLLPFYEGTIILLLIAVLGSAIFGGAVGWLVIQSGYDWMRSRAAIRNHLRILRAKLQRQN